MDSLFQGNVSRAPILPLPASIIAAEQREQRDMLKGLGTCRSDCGEVDDYVLMGGFERGSVVGISAEDETQIGLAVCSPKANTHLLECQLRCFVVELTLYHELARSTDLDPLAAAWFRSQRHDYHTEASRCDFERSERHVSSFGQDDPGLERSCTEDLGGGLGQSDVILRI